MSSKSCNLENFWPFLHKTDRDQIYKKYINKAVIEMHENDFWEVLKINLLSNKNV